MLNDLNHEFSIIGLSEIKFTQNKEVVSSIEIPNYNFIYQQSFSNYGGVGIYIKENIKFVRRN
jgi:exonuclease III